MKNKKWVVSTIELNTGINLITYSDGTQDIEVDDFVWAYLYDDEPSNLPSDQSPMGGPKVLYMTTPR